MAQVTWVVPCYNEAQRLDLDAWVSLIDGGPEVNLLMVNDGSRDQTEQRLQQLAALRPDRIQCLSLARNRGKAEAVRRGLLQALDQGAHVVGYLDADLATPVTEAQRLTEVLERSEVDVVLAARVGLLGRRIERSAVRHYLGRVFATLASLALSLRIYDTQCGAKLFRSTPTLLAALEMPFLSRWAFDVELIGRLLVGARGVPGVALSGIVEEPLLVWRDIAGSKLKPGHMLRAVADVGRIGWNLRARRRAARAGL
jgi:dolichyl-phosphate beta-glucosyltransferase